MGQCTAARVRGIVLSLTRLEGLGQGSERKVLGISVEETDAAGRFTGVIKGLDSPGAGSIICDSSE